VGQRIGYQRVSTVDQNTDRQLDGVELDKVFTDKASGKDINRPELARAIEYLRDGDTLVVPAIWKTCAGSFGNSLDRVCVSSS
jgi:DNA invertase Pin-like site-specific DNA recombinase